MTNKHRILIVFFILTFSTVVAFLFHRPIKVSYNQGMAAETSSFINASTCSGRTGFENGLPGNIAESTVSFDASRQYITWVSDIPMEVLITKYNGTSCTTPEKVNEVPWTEPQASHDAPAVYVDGLGYIYVAYLGNQIYSSGDYLNGDPYMRRSTFPHNITSWQPEVKMRFANLAEMTGNTLADGAVMFVGHSGAPSGGTIDIIEPGGTYRWSAMRQVVANNNASAPAGNKFMKTIFEPSPTNPNRIYVTWGWACGGSEYLSPECQGYSNDSHEVFFAYTDDGGVTWKNKNNTKTVTAPLCPRSITYCLDDPSKGIAYNDPAFILTNTRQREQRAIWEDPDGTIYIAFTKSVLNESPPGALMMLKFKIGGNVTEYQVNAESHSSTGAIRKEGSSIYIWAATQNYVVYEYNSTDGGSSWQRSVVCSGCARLQGNSIMMARNMVSLAMLQQLYDSSTDHYYSHIYYYQKTFSGGVNPPPPGPVPPPPPATISASPSSVALGATITVTFNNPSPTSTDWMGVYTPGSANGAAIDWKYANTCNQTGGGTPLSSGSCTFNISTGGSYEFRLQAQNEFDLLATSNPVSVAAPATISATPSSVQIGDTITVSFTNQNPTTTDWMGLYTPGSANGASLNWKYVNSCTQGSGANPLASGSCTFTIASAGTYEFRLQAQNEFDLLATSNPVTVPLPGDFNVDHIINSLDWSYMNSKWFTNDAKADLDKNGIVNSLDFSIMNSNWLKTW